MKTPLEIHVKRRVKRRGPLSTQPAWRVNLLLFGLLIAIVLAYFYWQVRQLQQTFLTHSLEHSRMLANVIEQNARTALLSQKAVEKIVQIFLGNTARFVAYLEAVEPFSASELSEFAHESGLSGIRIVRVDGTETQGPESAAIPAMPGCPGAAGRFTRFPEKNLYVAAMPLVEQGGCVVTGLASAPIAQLDEEISLNRLLDALTGLAGIQYVRIENQASHSHASLGYEETQPSHIHFVELGGETIAESRIPFGGDILVAGLDTRHFMIRTRQIWFEFFFFAGVLAMLGIAFSWILHRFQARYLTHIQAVEREMAEHREDAALGRAAAAIAHEIRNPLNAIGMGLQRLRIEAPDLDDEYRDLVATLLQAVKRTDAIVSDLRRYARPAAPIPQRMSPSAVVRDILDLYRRRCADQSIDIIEDLSFTGDLTADPQMVAQMVENLIKNAVEAQPGGGHLKVSLARRDGHVMLAFENRGFDLAPSEAAQILSPYFTTKARGTGLGLSIVRKIVAAHSGRLAFAVPEAGVLRIEIRLPLSPKTVEEEHEDSDR
jgi:signal transduction histidine kinase